ncbi:DUF1919 domain-containing protein [uncultured Senegalimassilia sp.]|uniref:DUF1919 domain-containing protein n=1 Tax=uncultured Senegalimassilia sp. TaxID=1714350 RepID=UPI0025D9CF88|nr:DUF1919 domain-containing protein [uncultured Senegalimassilia sp.]
MSHGFKQFMRKGLDKRNRARLTNPNPTVFASNCNGGVMTHDLGLQFRSPTVNLYIRPKEYVRFLGNLQHYLYEARFVAGEGADYPVGILDDIRVDFVHYQSFDEAVAKWNSGLDRIDFDNAFYVMTERDGCTHDDLVAFDELPYRNKVVFVSKPMPDIASAFYDPSFPVTGGEVDVLSNYVSRLSGRRYLDAFDYVSFFNGDGIKASSQR